MEAFNEEFYKLSIAKYFVLEIVDSIKISTRQKKSKYSYTF